MKASLYYIYNVQWLQQMLFDKSYFINSFSRILIKRLLG